MDESTGGVRGILDGLLGLASDYVSSSVRVGVKTNFGPEIPIATASLKGSSGGEGGQARPAGIAGILGFRAAVIVRNAGGEIIATYGEVPKTEIWRALLVGAVALGLVVLIVRGAIR